MIAATLARQAERVERLGDHARRAERLQARDVGVCALAVRKITGTVVAEQRAQALERGGPVDVGHHHVEQHDVGPLALATAATASAAEPARGHLPAADALQRHRGDRADVGLVVDEQQPARRSSAASSSPTRRSRSRGVHLRGPARRVELVEPARPATSTATKASSAARQRLGRVEGDDAQPVAAHRAGQLLAPVPAAVVDGDRRRGAVQREREAERRALARLALGPDPARVLLDDRARDRQPEPGAALLALVGRVDLAEALEDRLQLVGRDAAARRRRPRSARRRRRATTLVRTHAPAGENLTALATRFTSACTIRSGSAISSSVVRPPS